MHKAETRSQAVADQLRAEIEAAHRTSKSVADQIGVNPAVYRRYLNGETEIPMSRLYDSIDALGMSDIVFFTRAKERYEQQ